MLPSKPSLPSNMRDHPKSPQLQNPEEEEEEEEALSLCDLPLNPKDNGGNNNNKSKDLSSYTLRSSESPDYFEFFSDLKAEMCPADEIIFRGKLIPFKDQSPPIHRTHKTSTTEENRKIQTHLGRRCDSFSKLESPIYITRSDSSTETARLMMRNSRSLDYRKLHRSSKSMASPVPEIERNSSAKSAGKSDMGHKKAAKPRWYLLMFGMVKFPPEMELSDIKNRQFRRNPPSTLFPPPLDVHGKGSWRLLRALSCKDHASVAVTASVCFQHA